MAEEARSRGVLSALITVKNLRMFRRPIFKPARIIGFIQRSTFSREGCDSEGNRGARRAA